MIINKIQKGIKDPLIILNYVLSKGFFNWLPDEPYLKLMYYLRMREKLNIKDPKTYNQKLQWLKLYDRNPSYTSMVDKLEVRKYIKSSIGEKFLIPLIGVWDKAEDIDFNKLPNKFVLKCTHDSGGVIVCNDKSMLDIEKVKRLINSKLKKNYYYHAREWPYKNIKPRIICEEYIVDKNSNELLDYKFMCFNGTVKCSFVCKNRGSKSGLNVDFYDENWKMMDLERHYPSSKVPTSKPENYELMLQISEKLSSNLAFLRVDFYEVNGQLYIGELTFYPGSGFEKFSPTSYDYTLGKWLKLPEKVDRV